ncbi:hypothetical protein I7I53_02388 [Histoplasma capsulatum var. duboisii H88]|uniref:Uncharacterized protein n=1 Tax=Ajellomyces capsulatus (strain H88) TaxID=544711 RepID=A0A8A1LRW5_AJEC8|nr:hypothetical protein I7I53_02388 [Histoplasma capsulatum var. duboisii H88]
MQQGAMCETILEENAELSANRLRFLDLLETKAPWSNSRNHFYFLEMKVYSEYFMVTGNWWSYTRYSS